MKRIKILFFVLALFLTGSIKTSAESSKKYDAMIIIDENYSYSDNIFSGNLSVTIDELLLNDHVKLSYHIEDVSGNVIVFENQRLVLNDFSNMSLIPLTVDLNELFEQTGFKEVVLAFDLVDEENVYWFSGNTALNCNLERIVVENHHLKPIDTTVYIKHDAPDIIKDKDYAVNVSIDFGETGLYNENVKLSYRIYNSKKELILGENERYDINIDGNTLVTLHLNDLPNIPKNENLEIIFDLVDEENVYWFSQHPDIQLKTRSIMYDYDFTYTIKQQYKYVVTQQYFQIVINVTGIIVIAIITRKIYKRIYKDQ